MNRARLSWPLAVSVAVTALTLVLLRMEGRRWWCECGEWSLISSDAWGSHNSQDRLT